MPLHRDIFWVGRQWAVTGRGMQAVDQKQKSKFDIEISRLWDDDLLDGLSGERWFNLDDFSQGLAIARARYPEPPHRAKPAPKIEPVKPEAGREAKGDAKGDVKAKTASRAAAPGPANASKSLQTPARQATPAPPRNSVAPLKEGVSLQPPPPPSRPRSPPAKPVPEVEPATPVVAKFAMRLEGGSAKFTPMWRIRIKR
jgi:hypothetical protein